MPDSSDTCRKSVLALATALAIASPASAEVFRYYVDKAAPAGGDGHSWQTAFRDLQDATWVQTTQDAEVEIRIAQGVYTPDSGTHDRSRFFAFHRNLGSSMTLSLQGSFAGLQGADPNARDYVTTRTVLSGDLLGDDAPGFVNRSDNSYGIALIGAKKNLYIDGITVRGASAEDAPDFSFNVGMVAYSMGASSTSLHVTNCSFEENDVLRGTAGGLNVAAGDIFVYRCRFLENRVRMDGGGGLVIKGDGYVGNCLFDSNRARFGGAIYLDGAISLSMSVLSRNHADYQGGATFGDIGANACLFVGNSAGSSGGAMAGSKGIGAVACTFAENSAPFGSAISALYGSAYVSNSIFWGSKGDSAAIRMFDSVWPGRIEHCIVEGGIGAIASSGVPAEIGPIILDLDPKFVRPASIAIDFNTWNYRLRADSPAIGIGGDSINFLADLDENQYWSKFGPADAGCYFSTRYECDGDMSPRDLIVDDRDFVGFVQAYEVMISPPASPDADINRDGVVDDADFSLFVVSYDRLLCPFPW